MEAGCGGRGDGFRRVALHSLLLLAAKGRFWSKEMMSVEAMRRGRKEASLSRRNETRPADVARADGKREAKRD